MKAQGWMSLKVLANKFSQEPAETFFKGLPAEEEKLALNQEIQSTEIAPLIAQPEEIFSRIHYSWLPEVIEQFPKSLQGPLLNALPYKQSKGAAKIMGYVPALDIISRPVKQFLLAQLYAKLKDKEVLPLPYLPQSGLNALADLSKTELVQMVDLLGLQDLAESIRSIVDKKKLRSLYMWLSPLEQQYLKICLTQIDKLRMTKLDFRTWETEKDNFKAILHRRGLIRLAKALSGQHPDLIWHIRHILDIGRAANIKKHYTKATLPGVTPSLIQQLVALMNFLKQKSEA